MMKKTINTLLAAIAICTLAATAHGQYTSDGVELRSNISLGTFGASSGNDCWGYRSPGGREYALMGLSNKVAFVDVTDPDNPVWFASVPHSSSTWADVKTYDEYAYIVSEASGTGIQIVDLTDIDNHNITHIDTLTDPGRSHNVAIDVESGFLYTCGSNEGSARTVIYDLQDPANPVFVGTWGTYEHDMQIVTYTSGDYAGRQIMFGASEGRGLDVVDVTNKSNTVLLARVPYANVSYAHQVWVSDDRQFAYLNDELDGINRTSVFDISDIENPVWVNDFSSGTGSTDHNEYLRDGFLFSADYTSGMRIHDLSADPVNPPLVGWFDTHPETDGGGYEGAWSLYPYLPSGIVLVSDINRGLFVLDPTEALQGRLTFDYPDGTPELIAPGGGTTMRVRVIETGQAAHQPGTGVLHVDAGDAFVAYPMSDLGNSEYLATFPEAPCGTVVNWYVSAETTESMIFTDPADAPTTTHETLSVSGFDVAIEDDFETDTGWTVENFNLSDGAWERGVPAGDGTRGDPLTDFDGSGSCYVTDNAAGNSDVDGGPTVLTSPAYDLTTVSDPTISFGLWMHNDDGDDLIEIALSDDDGGSWTTIDQINSTQGWKKLDYRVSDYITPTNTVRLRFSVADQPNNSVTEAAVDALQVVEQLCDTIDLVDVAIEWGTLINGGLDEILESDDNRLVVLSSFGFSVIHPYETDVIVGAVTSDTGLAALDVIIESKLNTPGGLTRVRAYNWQTQSYQQIGQFAIGTVETVEVLEDVDATDLIRGDGRIQLSIRSSVPVAFQAEGFRSRIDHVGLAPSQ